MKKKLIILFHLTFILSFAQKENFTVQNSKTVEIVKNVNDYNWSHLFSNDRGFTFLKIHKKTSKKDKHKLFFEHYDSELNLEKEGQKIYDYDYFLNFYDTNNSFGFFYETVNKKKDKYSLWVSYKTNEMDGFQSKELLSLNSKTLKKSKNNQGWIKKLDDYYAFKIITKNKGKEITKLILFNSDLEEIYKDDQNFNHEIDLPGKFSNFHDEKYIETDEAFYSIMKNTRGLNVNKDDRFIIKKRTKSNTKYHQFQMDKKVLNYFLPIVYKDDKVICIGFFRDKFVTDLGYYAKGNGYEGYIYYEFDKNLNIITEKKHEFSKDFLKDYYGKEENLFFLGDYVNKYVFLTKDNGILFSCEKQLNDSGRLSSDPMKNRQPLYVRGNISTIKFNNKGEMIWAKMIGKNQKSKINTAFHSYTANFVDDKLYYFFNTNKTKTNKLGNTEYVNRGKNDQILYSIILDSDGNRKDFKIKTYSKNNIIPTPLWMVANENEVFIKGWAKNKYCFFKIYNNP